MAKFLRVTCIALAAGCLSTVCLAAEASAFDGAWDVTLSCPGSADGRALAYSYAFPAQVKNGVLHGERGEARQPGWMQLDGPIGPNGAASLIAEGLTNLPNYALYNVSKGTPYKHPVQAQFGKDNGSGSWITVRTCNFAFVKR